MKGPTSGDILNFHRVTAACRGQEEARYRHFAVTHATMAVEEQRMGSKREVICGFFPGYNGIYTVPSLHLRTICISDF